MARIKSQSCSNYHLLFLISSMAGNTRVGTSKSKSLWSPHALTFHSPNNSEWLRKYIISSAISSSRSLSTPRRTSATRVGSRPTSTHPSRRSPSSNVRSSTPDTEFSTTSASRSTPRPLSSTNPRAVRVRSRRGCSKRGGDGPVLGRPRHAAPRGRVDRGRTPRERRRELGAADGGARGEDSDRRRRPIYNEPEDNRGRNKRAVVQRAPP